MVTPVPLPGEDLALSAMLADPSLEQIEVQVEVATDPSLDVEAGPDYAAIPHDENLAEYLTDDELMPIAQEAQRQFDDDLASRADWEKTCKDGLEFLGLELKPHRSKPFDGATSVVDPIMTEAVVRFQSNAIQEIFPANGPVEQKIWGTVTEEKRKAAERKKNYMNCILVSKMQDYRHETERLLWELAYCGAAFRKTYLDPETQEPVSMFIPAEDVIIPYGYPSLWQAPRYSLIHRYYKDELKRLQLAGFYRECDLPSPAMESRSDFKEAKDKATKEIPSAIDGRHVVVEMYCRLNLKNFDQEDAPSSPYIVTFEKEACKILSIRRNWAENDPKKKALHSTTQYTFIPGPGSYGFGYIHLLGNLAKADTLMLRMLIDAATCENLPGGFMDGRLRTTEGSVEVQPFEWIKLAFSGEGNLSNALYPFPFKGPSQTLAALRTEIRQTIKELASIADPMNGATNGEIPVGTLLALIEQKLKVMTAVQARLHASLKQEFSILERVIADQLAGLVGNDPNLEYPYDVEGGERTVKLDDFNGKFVSEPVSDPNLATFSQRLAQLQAVMNAAQQAPPGIYDIRALHREFAKLLTNSSTAIQMVPDKSHVPALDPISEVQALMEGKPVKAYPFQDHDAHLSVLMDFVNNPKRKQDVGQMPQGQQILAAAMALAAERIGYIERRRIEEELGAPLPPVGEPLPPEIEIQLSALIAKASRRVFEKDAKEAQQAEIQAQMQDPVLQMQMREIALKEFQAQAKAKNDEDKILVEAAAKDERESTERMRIAQQQQSNADKLRMELMWLRDEMQKTQPSIAEMQARTAKILSEIGNDQQQRLQ